MANNVEIIIKGDSAEARTARQGVSDKLKDQQPPPLPNRDSSKPY